jgi:hypothetical protein
LAANAAERAEIDEVVTHINGILDSYKVYTDSGSADSSRPDYPADGDDDDPGDDPGEGDPGNGGGNGEDPEPPAGGGDEGSGGPLDRGNGPIIININE